MQKLLDNLTKEIQDYYNHVGELPLIPSVNLDDIHKHLRSRYDFKRPLLLEEINSDVQNMLRNWNLHSSHPHYLGLFVPGTLFPSIVADTLTALYNPQLGDWSHAPGANEIERYTLQHLMMKFGMDPNAGSANFTTGGTEANLSAVLTALTKAFPECVAHGLRSLKSQPVFYVSEEAHHSFIKIGQITGLGYEAVRNIKTDNDFKLDMDELKRKFNEDKKRGLSPFMVVGTAGTTSAGVIDPLPQIAQFCDDHNLWYHVDAAYGGAAIMSDRLKHFLTGIDKADTITCDAHKWFSVSMSAGMFFCRHKNLVAETFHAGAAYLPQSDKETIDAYSTTLQCSRRFIGLKLFMTLAQLGDKGYADLIEDQAELGNYLRDKLKNAGFRIINTTPLPVVCFSHPKVENGELTTTEVLKAVYARKKFWISHTKLKNSIPVLRACITSFRTNAKDIDELVKELSVSVDNQSSIRAVLK